MDTTETTLDGKRLGRYRIIRKLGAGGMADVYLAEDESMGREVALKVLPPEFARNPESVARFQKEVRAAARLSHPHIVTVYDVGDARIEGLAWHYYAMQVLPGGDLKARIGQGVSEQDALTLLAQIASALKYAHEHGIVHRDIKPENILFSADGQAVLTDLGIAKAVGSGTRMTGTGMSIGTPHYMSPEQARGQDVDGRSDLYALGVLLYEMLTGTVPYDAADTFAIGIAHISEPIPQLPEALNRYQSLLNTLMAKQPEQRFADAGELLGAIETLQQGGSFVGNVSANEQEHVTASAEIPNATRVMPAADDDALVGANKGANTGADNDTNNGNNKPGLSPAIWGIGVVFLILILLAGLISDTRETPTKSSTIPDEEFVQATEQAGWIRASRDKASGEQESQLLTQRIEQLDEQANILVNQGKVDQVTNLVAELHRLSPERASHWDSLLTRAKNVERNNRVIAGQYLDNLDGTVTDLLSGLQWMRCSLGQRWDGNTCQGRTSGYNWNDARSAASSHSYAGYNHWRLPTIGELNSLVYCSSGQRTGARGSCLGTFQRPTINHKAFPNTMPNMFWSSSSTFINADLVSFYSGSVTFNDKRNERFVRLVRNAQ